MNTATRDVIYPQRRFLPAALGIRDWDSVAPFFEKLKEEEPGSVSELEAWLEKFSELEAAIFEELAWRYIRMTCNTADETLRKSYTDYIENVVAKYKIEENLLRKKQIESEFLPALEQKEYRIPIRTIKNKIALFRSENIPLISSEQTLSQKYGETTGAMLIEHDGEQYTLQKAASLLEKRDRGLRETIWQKVITRRLQDQDELDRLFDNLIGIRQKISANAGFENYMEYCFRDLGRFDYNMEDCRKFHEAVESEIKPIYTRFQEERRKKLGLEKLRPWDLSVDVFGAEPLRPFKNGKELVQKTARIFHRLDAEFGRLFEMLEEKELLDLESRKGKTPGGYNYGLPETGFSFIFMNAVGTIGDLITMMHESGHAIHSRLMQSLRLYEFRNVPSEIAELASMSMELMTMDYWDEFFDSPAEHKRAKFEVLSRSITILPWIATIDCFQAWVYSHPGHSADERRKEWIRIYKRFHGDAVDWSGLDDHLGVLWQKQIHVFDVPFYYIEYGIAQLGAIAIWRNYKKNPSEAIAAYKRALSLGYTQTIPEVYKAAGISFGFSHSYIRELAELMVKELESL